MRSIKQKWGHEVWRNVKSRFSRSDEFGGVDIFGLFDLVSRAKGEFSYPGSDRVFSPHIAFIQVNITNRDGNKVKSIEDWVKDGPVGIVGEYWVWKDRVKKKEPSWDITIWEKAKDGSIVKDRFELDWDGGVYLKA